MHATKTAAITPAMLESMRVAKATGYVGRVYDDDVETIFEGEGATIRHGMAGLANPIPRIDAYMQYRNAGGCAAEDMADAKLIGLISEVAPSHAWIAACAAYIAGLDHNSRMMLEFYQGGGIEINRWMGTDLAGRTPALAEKILKAVRVGFKGAVTTLSYGSVTPLVATVPTGDLTGAAGHAAPSKIQVLEYLCRRTNEVVANGPPLDKDVMVFRAAVAPFMFPGPPTHAKAKHCAQFASRTLVSTSVSSTRITMFMADNWKVGKQGYLARITIPKGTRCLFMIMQRDLGLNGELEILLPVHACFASDDEWHEDNYLTTHYLKNKQVSEPRAGQPLTPANYTVQYYKPYQGARVLMRSYSICPP